MLLGEFGRLGVPLRSSSIEISSSSMRLLSRARKSNLQPIILKQGSVALSNH
jgi:hypothetical protein